MRTAARSTKQQGMGKVPFLFANCDATVDFGCTVSTVLSSDVLREQSENFVASTNMLGQRGFEPP